MAELSLLSRLDEVIARQASPKTGRLPAERALAESLGVGRADLRKALEVLEAQGRIHRHVGRGTFVAGLPESADAVADRVASRTSPHAAMEARLLVEPELAALAAGKATSDHVAELRRLTAAMRRAESWDAYAELDWRFHNMIATATDNVLLGEIQQVLNQVRRRVVWGRLETPPPHPQPDYHSFAEHDAIVAAIASRDPRTAAMAMRTHLDATRRRLLKD